MRGDLVKRLREGVIEHRKRWTGDTHDDLGGTVDCDATDALMIQAADRIEALEAERDALREAVTQILTLDRGVAPEVRDADAALDAWWSNLCAQYREIARAALNREPDT